MLVHMVYLCLTFHGTTRLFSKVASSFYIPTSNFMSVPVSLHLHQHLILPTILIHTLVLSHHSFYLIFPGN